MSYICYDFIQVLIHHKVLHEEDVDLSVYIRQQDKHYFPYSNLEHPNPKIRSLCELFISRDLELIVKSIQYRYSENVDHMNKIRTFEWSLFEPSYNLLMLNWESFNRNDPDHELKNLPRLLLFTCCWAKLSLAGWDNKHQTYSYVDEGYTWYKRSYLITCMKLIVPLVSLQDIRMVQKNILRRFNQRHVAVDLTQHYNYAAYINLQLLFKINEIDDLIASVKRGKQSLKNGYSIFQHSCLIVKSIDDHINEALSNLLPSHITKHILHTYLKGDDVPGINDYRIF